MKNTTGSIVLIAAVTAMTSSVLNAQTVLSGRAFVNVNLAAQTEEREINTTLTVPVYGQNASAATTIDVGRGPMFDISGGYRVWQDVAVAVGFSYFSKQGNAVGSASIPSPIFFNQFATVTLGPTSVDRSDKCFYVLGVWFLPISDKIDVALSLGPSFTSVKQELIANLSIPAGTQTATPIVESQSATIAGVNVGIDATYLFTKMYGAGVFVRYNGGSGDLPSATDVKAGGFQVGVGARVRF